MAGEEQKGRPSGIYLAMPLKKNVPVANDAGWDLTNCPECGQDCWQRPVPGWLQEILAAEICTECAARKE